MSSKFSGYPLATIWVPSHGSGSVAAATMMLGAPATVTATVAPTTSTAAFGPVGTVASIVGGASIRCEYSKARGTASATTTSATPGIVRVCTSSLRTNGNGLALHVLAFSVVTRVHSIIAREVLAPPIGLHGRVLLGKAGTLNASITLIFTVIHTSNTGEPMSVS